MSGLDPLAALAAQAAAQAQFSALEGALDLGVSAGVLQAQISVGDLLDAVVLPPQNGVDRISLLGQTVAAQLPPGIDPGEAIVLQVTGFQGQRIFVRNLGPVDPQNPPSTLDVRLPSPDEAAPQSAVLTNRPVAPQTPGTPPRPTLAPPREVFVAASVRPSVPPATPAPLESKLVAHVPEGEVELRLAVNRTADALRAPAAQPGVPLRPQAPAPPPPMPGAPAARALPQTPQASLLARLRVPISASTLVAARLIDDAARHVTTSYHRLDQALAKVSTADPRVGSLRSLLAFVGKMDLRNPRALPEQLAAFVSHVVDGAENKVAQIVRALTNVAEEASQLPENSPNAPQSAQLLQQRAASPASLPAPLPPLADLPPAVAAHVAERTVALDHDVKSAIMALIHNPPREITPAATQALSSALGATTALQLNVLSAQSSDPGTIAIALPAYFYDGGKPAQLAISRDAPQGGKAMDGDNFHVSFVLDTKTMGTIAIDLQTVGRAVSVNVKTQRASAASRFRDTLGDLRQRLEGLRYRISSMGADVATTPSSNASTAVMPPKSRSARSNVDMRA